jgi:hypothetical protein
MGDSDKLPNSGTSRCLRPSDFQDNPKLVPGRTVAWAITY